MVHETFKLLNAVGSEWVLGLLIILSLISLGVIMKRYLSIERLSRLSQKFWKEQGDLLFQNITAQNLTQKASEIRDNYSGLESDLLQVIAHSDKSLDRDKIIQSYLEQRKIRLEKNLNFLGTLGSNAPFIGLLGTVLGIIRAFYELGQKGISNSMENISQGLAEALVATAIGLMVAIPAVVFFNLINKKIQLLLRRAESLGALVTAENKKQ